MASNFEIIPGGPNSHLIIHVPHSSRFIPAEIRAEILLSDGELEAELDSMTDSLTAELVLHATANIANPANPPTLFINKFSRFVIDPERFPDEREVMNKVGMGAVYLKSSTGGQLREPDFDGSQLIADYFDPYAKAFTDLVGSKLRELGEVTIIDFHSYRVEQHVNAVNHGQQRPPVCIGTDEFHTPPELLMQGNRFRLFKGPANKEYWSLFNPLDYTGNPEIMLWKKFDVGLQIVNNVSRMLSGGGGNIGLSKTLVDSYLCTDGKPKSVSPSFLGYDSVPLEVTNRDPRLAQTLFLRGYDMTSNAPAGVKNQKFEKPALDGAGEFRNTTGYALYKGVNPDFSNQGNNDIGVQGSIIFRYAEALLIFAEAKAELGTITQADIDRSINLIRDRVGMIHLDKVLP